LLFASSAYLVVYTTFWINGTYLGRKHPKD